MRTEPFKEPGSGNNPTGAEQKKMNDFKIDIAVSDGGKPTVTVKFFNSDGSIMKDAQGAQETLTIGEGDEPGVQNEASTIGAEFSADGYATQRVTLNPGNNVITLQKQGSAAAVAQSVTNKVKGIAWYWWVLLIIIILIALYKFWLHKYIKFGMPAVAPAV